MNLSQRITEQIERIKRSTVEIISEEELEKKLTSALRNNQPLKVKAGFDPTTADIHLGHAVLLRKLRDFQELGHIVYFIMGDFTAQIGDPSGRIESRPVLSRDKIRDNSQTYARQAFKIMQKEKTRIFYNSKWFDKMTLREFSSLLKEYTVARLLERDDFTLRMKERKPLTLLEFIYPLLQAYDSVKIKADIELGGTDQKFNLLVGRALQESFGQEPQVVITLPLLVGLDGENKMSKSLGNYIGIQESPRDIFGKTMSISDDLMYHYFEVLTEFNPEEIRKMHPRQAKELLAFTFVSWFYSDKVAEREKNRFKEIFSQRKLTGQDFPFYKLSFQGENVVDIIFKSGLVSSRNEIRRLIKQKAVEFEKKKVLSDREIISKSGILKIGKKKFLKIVQR